MIVHSTNLIQKLADMSVNNKAHSELDTILRCPMN
jgi:hypothetical protein